MSPERKEILQGATYKVRMPDGECFYLIVNEQDGAPFEVFVRYDNPDVIDWVDALTILITRALRAGESLVAIAAELQEIHAPNSGHFVPGTNQWCPSRVARIGRVLQAHIERNQPAEAT